MASKPKGQPWQLLDEVDEPIDPSPHPPDIGAQFARRNSAIVSTATITHHDRDGRIRDWLLGTTDGSQRKVIVPECEIDVFPDEDSPLRTEQHQSKADLSQDSVQSFASDGSAHHEGGDIVSFPSPPAHSLYHQPAFPPESLDGFSTDSQICSLPSSKYHHKGNLSNPPHHHHQVVVPMIDTLNRTNSIIHDRRQHTSPRATSHHHYEYLPFGHASSSSSSSFVRSLSDVGSHRESPRSPAHPVSPRQQFSQQDSDASTVEYDPAESVSSPISSNDIDVHEAPTQLIRTQSTDEPIHRRTQFNDFLASPRPDDDDDLIMVPPSVWEQLNYTNIPKHEECQRDEELDKLLDDDEEDVPLTNTANQAASTSVAAEKPKTVQPSIDNYLLLQKPQDNPSASSSQQQQQQQQDSFGSLFSSCSSLSTAKSFSSMKPLCSPYRQPQIHPSLTRTQSSGVVSMLNYSVTSFSNSAESRQHTYSRSPSTSTKDPDEQHSAFMLRSKPAFASDKN